MSSISPRGFTSQTECREATQPMFSLINCFCAFPISHGFRRSVGLCLGRRSGGDENSPWIVSAMLTFIAVYIAGLTFVSCSQSPGIVSLHLWPIASPDQAIFVSDLRARLGHALIGTITTPGPASCTLATLPHASHSQTGWPDKESPEAQT
jgi:hypothetical protein